METSAKLRSLGLLKTLTTLKNSRDRARTGTGITPHRILSPVRLPIPPLGQMYPRNDKEIRQRVT